MMIFHFSGKARTYLMVVFAMVLLGGTAFLAFQNSERSDSNIATSAEESGDAALREQLTEMQYYVTQEDGTEPAFDNEYWDEKREGMYVDVVSGEALFSSLDKYDSKTGWPSFTKPIAEDVVTLRTDYVIGYPRIEVRSAGADSHLGHLFADGPKDAGGKRYCINSAALRFVPLADMEKEGYGEHLPLFRESGI